MGQRTTLNFTTSLGAAKAQRSLHVRFDLLLLLSVITLTAIGLLMVYSASVKYTLDMNKEPTFMLERQTLWVLLGAVVALVLSYINYHLYQRFLLPMMGIIIVALFAVLVIRDTSLGAVRSFLDGSIRPSEAAKLGIIIYISFWLYLKRDVMDQFTFGLMPMMVILGITGGLVLLQPDISAAATVVVLGIILFFLAGGAPRQLVPIFLLTVVFVWLIVMVYPNGRTRLVEFWNGLMNPTNASYHVQRSFEAVINGGLFGVGIGKGPGKFQDLPVAPTDSIFAVIAEETGLIGAGIVIVLFVIFLWRGLRIAQNAPDLPGRLMAAGITIWIVLEAVINMGVMVNLLPFAGNALPFISFGGSSIMVTFAGVGILMNIARNGIISKESSEGRPYRAVVDLRGRNSRRGVSRSVRSNSSRE